MCRPLAALRLLSSSSSPHRLLSPSPLHHLLLLSRRDDDREDSHPSPPPPPFSPRPLLTSASGAAVLLGLRGWRTLPPAASPPRGTVADAPPVRLTLSRSYSLRVAKGKKKTHFDDEHSHRAVNTALWCNFLVFSLKFGVWLSTSSHVMLAELVHSVADFANQLWLFKRKICMVLDICGRNILLGFRCYHCAWSSEFMEFSTSGEHSLCCISDWWVVPN